MEVYNCSSEGIRRAGSKPGIHIMVNLTRVLIFRQSGVTVEQLVASPEQ